MENTTIIFISILSFLPAGRVLKKPKKQDCRQLQKAAIHLLEQQQNLCSLLREAGVSAHMYFQNCVFSKNFCVN